MKIYVDLCFSCFNLPDDEESGEIDHAGILDFSEFLGKAEYKSFLHLCYNDKKWGDCRLQSPFLIFSFISFTI